MGKKPLYDPAMSRVSARVGVRLAGVVWYCQVLPTNPSSHWLVAADRVRSVWVGESVCEEASGCGASPGLIALPLVCMMVWLSGLLVTHLRCNMCERPLVVRLYLVRGWLVGFG